MNNKKIKEITARNSKLRISVGTLIKVLFTNPETGLITLALERIGTLRRLNGESNVQITVKPFGGGVRITNPQVLKKLTYDFKYDSERSREERDFRILVLPETWGKIKEICKEHLHGTGEKVFDFSPDRELYEEFEDSLKIKIKPDQYAVESKGMVIEDLPIETSNVRAQGTPTVRIYYLFEGWIKSYELIKLIMTKSNQYSEDDFKKAALIDAEQGGKGRANSILTIGLNELRDRFNSIPPEGRNGPINFGSHQLEGNVAALFSEVSSLRYSFKMIKV